MAKFIVRIELRDSESADYDALHERLSTHGFSKQIPDTRGNGEVFLPNAEYVKQTVEGIYYVGHLAKSVAEKIRPNPKVLVTEAKDLFQIGLDHV
jgi:hypothetical protein